MQVAGGESGRTGSLNTQFGTWIWEVAQLAYIGRRGGLDSELARMELLWDEHKDDPEYVPQAQFCAVPYDYGGLCVWGKECKYWHTSEPSIQPSR